MTCTESYFCPDNNVEHIDNNVEQDADNFFFNATVGVMVLHLFMQIALDWMTVSEYAHRKMQVNISHAWFSGDAVHRQEELAQVRLPRAAQRRPRAHPARVASGASGVEDGRDEDSASLGTGVAQSGQANPLCAHIKCM